MLLLWWNRRARQAFFLRAAGLAAESQLARSKQVEIYGVQNEKRRFMGPWRTDFGTYSFEHFRRPLGAPSALRSPGGEEVAT